MKWSVTFRTRGSPILHSRITETKVYDGIVWLLTSLLFFRWASGVSTLKNRSTELNRELPFSPKKSRHEKVKQWPELEHIILYRSTRQYQPMVAVKLLHCLCCLKTWSLKVTRGNVQQTRARSTPNMRHLKCALSCIVLPELFRRIVGEGWAHLGFSIFDNMPFIKHTVVPFDCLQKLYIISDDLIGGYDEVVILKWLAQPETDSVTMSTCESKPTYTGV